MSTRIAAEAEPIPGYRLIERLGRGGFGEVWKVEAPGGILKAIKFVYGDLDEAGDSGRPAEQELKALHRVKSIRHPYILSLERFEVVDGQLCIVMELADRNLHDRFRECQKDGLAGIPREELLDYLEEAAEAIDLMNNHYQIQHLDIKPQNIFLIFNHIKVADFGLAKDMEGKQTALTGGVTPVYAAPETFEGQVTRYCDQYSLAIVYQEMLTGQRPFSGTTPRQLMMQHLHGTPDLALLAPNDRSIVQRALSKNPGERYPTCAEFVNALKRPPLTHSLPTPPVTATPPPPMAGPTPNNLRSGASVNPALTAKGPQLRSPAFSVRTGALPPLVGIARSNPEKALANARTAPPEISGDGVLQPALIVGVGQLAQFVLVRLRRAIRNRFGTATLPHLKMLYIDTDPATVQSLDSTSTISFDPGEVYLAKLNRPAHYTRPTDTQPSVETWMNPQLLYRIPRQPETSGIRVLGRLALWDHYRPLMQRVKERLEELISPAALDAAQKATGLGIRSNRPRVYLVAGIGGGTGGGMLVDLAYLLRHQLRLQGYKRPEVIGLTLVPPVDRTSGKSQGVANAYATLAEIAHFNSSSTVYEATFDLKEGQIVDRDPPLKHCLLAVLPQKLDTASLKPLIGQCSGYIYRELLSPVGAAADDLRTKAVFHTVGAYRMTWPRSMLLDYAARLCSVQLLGLWSGRESEHLAQPIRQWLDEQWARRQLSTEGLSVYLRDAVAAALETTPEAFVERELAALEGAVRAGTPAIVDFCQAMDRILALVGQPELVGQQHQLGRVIEVLDPIGKALSEEIESKLAETAVSFIEMPTYRLAGAEEAIRQLIERLRLTLEECETAAPLRERESAEQYARTLEQIAALDKASRGSRRVAAAQAAIISLRQYAAKRVEWCVVQSLAHLYRGMVNFLPDCLREVQHCRTRLQAIHQHLTDMAPRSEIDTTLGPGHGLWPDGCTNASDAAMHVVGSLTAEELLELDGAIQRRIRVSHLSLVKACLDSTQSTEALADVFREEALTFLQSKVPAVSSAEVLFQARSDQQAVQRELLQAYDEAHPPAAVPKGALGEPFCLLATPEDAGGARLASVARELLPDVALTTVTGVDEIVFHREQALLPTEVVQLGAIARDAFTHITHADQAIPHSRNDVNWTYPGKD